MATYKIIAFSDITRKHTLKNTTTGEMYYNVDLVVDASFPELNKMFSDISTIEQSNAIDKSIVGKEVEVEEFSPISYAAQNVKFV